MIALVIGRCPKTAEQLNIFCDKVIIALDKSFGRERDLPEFEKYQIVYCNSNISTPKGILPRTKELVKYINEFDVDIVFSNTKWDMVAAKLASFFVKKKILLLATNHNSYSWQDPRNVKKMSKLINRTTDCYVALASFVYDKLKQNGIRESRLVLIPNTVGYETWEVKDDYSMHKPFRVVYVAYVHPGKRQDMFINVLNSLKNYDIEVDCYGDLDECNEYVQNIEKKIKTYGLENKLFLRGRIENTELRGLLKNYDAYLSASHMEMSPINILEAMAAGLPLIAARVGGIPDLIEHEINGLLFEVDNAEDAAKQLARLIDDDNLRVKLAKEGRKQVSMDYTCLEAGKRMENKVLELLKK